MCVSVFAHAHVHTHIGAPVYLLCFLRLLDLWHVAVINFRKLTTIISSNITSSPFAVSSAFGFPHSHMLDHLILSYNFECSVLFLIYFDYFPSRCFICLISLDLFSNVLILSWLYHISWWPSQIHCWSLILYFFCKIFTWFLLLISSLYLKYPSDHWYWAPFSTRALSVIIIPQKSYFW